MRMLVPETPLEGDYDVVIALGGARQSNIDRLRYAADAAARGQAGFKHLIIAGSTRKLNEAEQENTSNYAPGAQTESDLCAAAAKVVREEYPGISAISLVVQEEKAGTPDVINSALNYLHGRGELEAGAKAAAVTTQIYQASTELDLARVAKRFGVSQTFVAGNPSPAKTIEARTPATYMSEVLRTLRAAVLASQDRL